MNSPASGFGERVVTKRSFYPRLKNMGEKLKKRNK